MTVSMTTEELSERYDEILRRISKLEAALSAAAPASAVAHDGVANVEETVGAGDDGESQVVIASSRTVSRLHAELQERGVRHYRFVRVPGDYYERDLEYRRSCLSAASVYHLCKSIIMENTRALPEVVDCSNPKNSKYYLVVVQYAYKLDTAKLDSFLHQLNDKKVAKKNFHLRLASEEDNDRLSGFEHNAVSAIGCKEKLPIIIAKTITELEPDFFFMGGGEVDVKLGLRCSEFVEQYGAMVADITDVKKVAADIQD